MSIENKFMVSGWAFGIITFAGLLILTGLTPKELTNKWHAEAIATGHAHWVIDTNSTDIPPVAKFEWNK